MTDTKEYTNKIFFVTMRYYEPRGGSIRVPAESEAQLREVFSKQFSQYKDFEILQCIAEEDIKPTAFGGVEDTPVMELPPSDDDDTPPSQKKVH